MRISNAISKMMLLVIIALSTFISTATAQEYVRIINNWKKDGVTAYKINIQGATVDAGEAPNNWWSAQWEMEKVNGQNAYRIKNRWNKDGRTDYYLHVENGKIEAGAIQPGWVSAMWVLQKIPGGDAYRIQNAHQTNQYLHIQGPTLAAGPIQSNWLSAIWTIEGFQQANSSTPTPTPTRPSAPIARNFTDGDINTPNILGAQPVPAIAPPTFNLPSGGTVYEGIKSKNEIDINGLGRCYDIRKIDPLQCTKETLQSGSSRSVFNFFRNNQARQFDFNRRQYAVPHGVNVVHDTRGKGELSYKHVVTANEYETEVLQEYRLGVGLKKVASAKTSIGFKNTNSGASKNKNLFTFAKQLATYYKADIVLDHPTYTHKIDDTFYNGVRRLGHDLSANDFITMYGTHFASTTAYGGNFLQRTTISQKDYSTYSCNETTFKLDVEGTIKGVNLNAGTTQGRKHCNGNANSITTKNMQLMTVGGDTNLKNPEKWARTVINNPTVVELQLTSIAKILTSRYFPNIPNIDNKRRLLEIAIQQKIKEANNQLSPRETHSFFTKTPVKFQLQVTSIDCISEGDAGSSGEYYGGIKMGFFGSNGRLLQQEGVINLSGNGEWKFSMSANSSKTVTEADRNKDGVMTYTIEPGRNLDEGYIQLWGDIKEHDGSSGNDVIGNYVQSAKNTGAISLQEGMVIGQTATRSLDFHKGGDHLRFNYTLRRLR